MASLTDLFNIEARPDFIEFTRIMNQYSVIDMQLRVATMETIFLTMEPAKLSIILTKLKLPPNVNLNQIIGYLRQNKTLVGRYYILTVAYTLLN
jgi:hypothetical protein